ncbi:MAG: LacI family transcriptional regulator [Chloroflexota bacterium]|nr:LacI family transcriptional regulator [Chloroflexota bacterium]
MARRATLKDVAELAGVSTATVARVLHGNRYVADETRRLVEAAVAETGYQINAVAQGLRRQRTATIGHLLHGVIPNPFFAGVALGAEQEALRHGYGVLMVNTHEDAGRERLGVETLIRRRVDGILFTTPTHEDNVRLALGAGIPVVQVERMTGADTPAVTVDNLVGARAAVEHLISLGHRRIAYMGADPCRMRERPGAARWPDVEQERLSGYRDVLRDHDLPVDETLIGLGRYYAREARERPNDGYVWMRRFLQREDPPGAVFATSDLLAAGALQAIYERSLRVPDDVSVVGFDDTYAPYFAPPMTTVAQPMVEIGEAAARLVFRGLSGPDGPAGERVVRLPTRLIVRASTGPAPVRADAEAHGRPRTRSSGPVIDDNLVRR